jgi:hypothetical protein
MSGRGHRGGLGFGGAVGLGIAAALLISVTTIGHAIFGQLKGAALLVLVFAEVAVCVILGAVALAVLGLLAYRGQLARYHLAERRVQIEQLAARWESEAVAEGRQAPPGVMPGARWTVRTEALEDGGEALRPTLERPAILGRRPRTVLGRHLEAVPEPGDGEGALWAATGGPGPPSPCSACSCLAACWWAC